LGVELGRGVRGSDTRLGPRFAIVLTGREHEEAVRRIAVADPGGPQAAFRRAVDADDHVSRPLVCVILGPGLGVNHGRFEGEIEQGLVLSDGLHSEQREKQERVFHGCMWKKNAAEHRIHGPSGQIRVLC
jgi:hypothetical protein